MRFKGYSIADVLAMSVDEALTVFDKQPRIAEKLRTLSDVGLGYIKLGQQATTLSGGEAQRIKLALELSKRQQGETLYILDEPTTGLHWVDVQRLMDLLFKLRDVGVDGVFVAVVSVAPDAVEQLCTSEHATRLAGEVEEEVELLGGEDDGLTAHRDTPLVGLDRQLWQVDWGSFVVVVTRFQDLHAAK